MKRLRGRSRSHGLVRLALFVAVAGVAAAQHAADWPDWAYGALEPLTAGSRVAVACASGSLPYDCAYQEAPVPDDGVRRSLPGSTLRFTRNETYADYAPADWYPAEHPAMPDIVAHGHAPLRLRACALCHYANGQGRMENAAVAGLPEAYILQQLQSFADGTRRSADVRKANTNEMAMIAARLTGEERRQAAAYFAAMPLRPSVRIIESAAAPQVQATSNGLMLPVGGAPTVPLGRRIIVVPETPQQTLLSRDPHGLWLAYVPVGSVAAGAQLAASGGGRAQPCALCHGPALRGLADIPGIAGRTPTYLMRQLWDFRQGARHSVLMQPVAQSLSAADMLNLSAYLASLEP